MRSDASAMAPLGAAARQTAADDLSSPLSQLVLAVLARLLNFVAQSDDLGQSSSMKPGLTEHSSTCAQFGHSADLSAHVLVQIPHILGTRSSPPPGWMRTLARPTEDTACGSYPHKTLAQTARSHASTDRKGRSCSGKSSACTPGFPRSRRSRSNPDSPRANPRMVLAQPARHWAFTQHEFEVGRALANLRPPVALLVPVVTLGVAYPAAGWASPQHVVPVVMALALLRPLWAAKVLVLAV
eukprot:CAMPEP_0181238548 /NCGR_PEP_ID=MMETSP1096-20121128/39418_1 /TAXON_ID=156174 ORGANISM="Chrysochromulina ericina, Strain CCMP281" /NCGR_SAMPLE_ID=MMETSP1096 /ASSEMBLY_ACC=CAM_ASM_000453 /LENGTH=240 /DNA_ID=CAMNT_0023334103 /DNA_START=364 /DNA_END=1085 /DNA_ORIENTATION=+